MNDLRVFSLTELTRGAERQRRIVVSGFDIPKRAFMVALAGLLPSLAVMGIFWVFVGEYAIGTVLIVEGLIFWLIEGRQSSGLRLRNYQALRDKQRAQINKFFCCGQPIHPIHGRVGLLVASSRPISRTDEETAARLDPFTATRPQAPLPPAQRRRRKDAAPDPDPWAGHAIPGRDRSTVRGRGAWSERGRS